MTAPEISGYRAPAGVGDVRALLDRLAAAGLSGRVQLVRADRVYGSDHLRLAATLARRAVEEGRARARDVATESVLYAAGERQIGKALAKLGLHADARAVAALGWEGADVAAFAAREGWTRDDAVLDGDVRALDALGVTATERAMLPQARWGDLVLERVALVDVQKT